MALFWAPELDTSPLVAPPTQGPDDPQQDHERDAVGLHGATDAAHPVHGKQPLVVGGSAIGQRHQRLPSISMRAGMTAFQAALDQSAPAQCPRPDVPLELSDPACIGRIVGLLGMSPTLHRRNRRAIRQVGERVAGRRPREDSSFFPPEGRPPGQADPI
jgi:hypothetical protein